MRGVSPLAVAALAAVFALLLPAEAPAGPSEPPSLPKLEKKRRKHVPALSLLPGSLRTRAEEYEVLQRIYIRKKRGLEYRHDFAVGERRMEVGVTAPVVRKKTFGLGLEIRF